jgi:hypothetical protein
VQQEEWQPAGNCAAQNELKKLEMTVKAAAEAGQTGKAGKKCRRLET